MRVRSRTMNRPTARTFHFWFSAFLIALVLAASPALAERTITVVDDGANYEDDADIGVDLALGDDGLQVVLTRKGRGALGNIEWNDSIDEDDLPQDALDRSVRSEALTRLAILDDRSTGVAFVIHDVTRHEVMLATSHRLEAIGCRIGDPFGLASFAFECGGEALRAVFGTTSDGVRVFLGQ